jgi:cytosine/adenosine deaminase-related metal-dependent hydrolase
MHLAESHEELRLLSNGDGEFRDLLEERSMWDEQAILPGSRPLDYLRTLANSPRSLVIHGNYLASDEIHFISERRDRMSVIYCPRTHDYFGHSDYPLREMLTRGVRVALGTDSRASNPDLSLLSEMRSLNTHFADVPPDEVLRMATLYGAEALGLVDAVGTLTCGKSADMIALPCESPSGSPYDALVHSKSRPSRVWMAGKEIALQSTAD